MDPSQSCPRLPCRAPPGLAGCQAARAGAEHRACRYAGLPAARPAGFRRSGAAPNGPSVGLARTDQQHLPAARDPRARVDRQAVDATPNGNAVSLDREAMKVADTDSAHALAIGLHRRWLGLFRTALGRAQ